METATTPSERELKAACQLVVQVRPDGRCDMMFGPRYASARQSILTELEGRKVPKSKAGITVLSEKLESAAASDGVDFTGCCRAEVHDRVANWIVETAAGDVAPDA